MKIFEGPKIPTPFGEIKIPDLETPPLILPKKPDARIRKAIRHGLGQDGAAIIGLIPWVGEVAQSILEDLHQAEIQKILTTEEYQTFLEYNKFFPSSVALARTLCFRKI